MQLIDRQHHFSS